jgi:hypothetical protein
VNPQNSLRVYSIIQYLQANDKFHLDWMDLHEMTNNEILNHLNLAGLELTKFEIDVLISEVEKHAKMYQTSEIARSMFEA